MRSFGSSFAPAGHHSISTAYQHNHQKGRTTFHYARSFSTLWKRCPMKEKRAANRRPNQRSTFADIARMIAPSNAPPWLPAHLEWSAQGLRHDRTVDDYRPTKAET